MPLRIQKLLKKFSYSKNRSMDNRTSQLLLLDMLIEHTARKITTDVLVIKPNKN